jgi:hypothetical protein
MLRYIPNLLEMGAEVTLMIPPELKRLAQQYVETTEDFVDADYFCPILHLLHWLKVTPENVNGMPYLMVPMEAQCNLGGKERKVGVAWSIGKPSDGDYPREVPLMKMLEMTGDAQVFSVQVQNDLEARQNGVHTFAYGDFADCAALMLEMDEIIAVDTAALHLAGAIGHPKVIGLLSDWHSWRWLAPWYNNVEFRKIA